MQRIILGHVKPSDSVTDALNNMLGTGTRAVVVSDGHGSRIVTAGDIFDAMNDAIDAGRDPKKIEVGEVKPSLLRVALQSPPILAMNRFGLPGSQPPMTLQEEIHFRSILKTHSGHDQYVVEEIGPEGAAIVTSSEAFAGHLSKSLMICKCSGEPVHTFEPDQVRVAGVCNKPHGKPVTCGLASIT